ncbi:MAG: hypothetical protein E7337_02985 [Clostridiales bacterium]|nr:hypothetical protein [Clostridiales bacterium]
MAIRIALAIVIVAGCTMVGKSMSASLRRRVRILGEVIRGTKKLRIHMTGMLETLPQALRKTDCEVFNAISERMEQNISAAAAWKGFRNVECKRGGLLDALSKRDLDILEQLFEYLGTRGSREQEIDLQNAEFALAEQMEGAKLQLSEREKLYVSISFMVGLMLAIVVV